MSMGSSTLRAGEWKARAEGTQEKVQTRKTGKVPLLGRTKGGGAGRHRKHLACQACACARQLPEGGASPAQFPHPHLPPQARSPLLACCRPGISNHRKLLASPQQTRPTGGWSKPPQISLPPEVGMAHHHWGYLKKNHLQPQPPQRASQRRTIKPPSPIL